MKTPFPYGKIDYDSYWNRYFEREDAIRALPTEAELKELARKSVVKDQLVLVALPEGSCAERGDTLTLCTASVLPKFNKPKVTVSLGRGLYDRTLEEALIGLRVGENCTVTIREQSVQATVLEIKRKQVPEPTDEMVAAMGVKDMKQNPITTYADYEAYICAEKTLEVLANINYYVMEMILADHPVSDYDEDDIRILGELEEAVFHKLFLETEGIDLYQQTKEQMRERWGCDSFKDFIKLRYEWYKMKIQQCHIYSNIMGIALEGELDPTSRYEVLSDLQMKMFDFIKSKLSGGNG